MGRDRLAAIEKKRPDKKEVIKRVKERVATENRRLKRQKHTLPST